MPTEIAQDRLAGTWNFAAIHSTANFSVKYLVASFRGSFEQFDASLEGDVLTGTVKVDSVTVKDPNFIGHLQSPDFFDAEQFPEITFRSTSIELDGDLAEVDGELTVKGITKPVHASGSVSGPTEDFLGTTRLGFTLETTIDRSAFGVSWNAPLPKGGFALSNDVKLIVELEFNRA